MALINENVSLSASLLEEFTVLEQRILSCTSCELCKTVNNRVIGKGSLNPRIIFIGEAPGKNEDLSGIPFCGRAGKVLDSMIEYMDIADEDWAVINTVKCRPPDNRAPKKGELASCKPFLDKQIELLDPALIILLGNTAQKAFCPGRKLEWGCAQQIDGRHILKIYHPAALIYTRSRTQDQYRFIDENSHFWK